MAIGNGEYGIVGRTTAGDIGILPIGSITATGQYGLPFRTTDGGIALMRVKPVDADAQFAFAGRLVGGEIGLFAPWPIGIACNDCDPLLQNEYTVFLSGLYGDFASYNGMHTLTWTTYPSGCLWTDGAPDLNGPGIHLWWDPTYDLWRLALLPIHNVSYCAVGWTLGSDPCAPTGVGVFYLCLDSACVDTDSCDPGAGEIGEVAANPDCPTCTGATPVSWTVIIASADAPCTDLNGTFTADRRTGPCNWLWYSSPTSWTYPFIWVTFSGGAIVVSTFLDATHWYQFRYEYGGNDPCAYEGPLDLYSYYGCPLGVDCYITPNFA